MDHMQYGYKPVDLNGGGDAPSELSGFTRRDFLVTAIASGFALASNPVRAQAIKTDSKGLTAGEVSVPVSDGEIPPTARCRRKAQRSRPCS